MKAVVVSTFGTAPVVADIPAPAAGSEHEMVVDVLAAGLHPRVRSQADGSHYTSTDELPLVPGIDGVGRGPDGALRYFVLPDTTLGSMAEQTLVDVRRSVVLTTDADPVVLAAAMNPAMSSWIALRKRIPFEAGRRVLILGATGNAGRMAVEVAALLGAQQIVAAGRNADALADLPAAGATDLVQLGADDAAERLGHLAQRVDVVLDYLWGQPAADALRAIVPARADDTQQLTWVQIGSTAGAAAAIPSAVLRAARLQIVGSGQGSVSTREIVQELAALADMITDGGVRVQARPVPLAEVERAWAWPADGARLVVTPQPAT